jgi:hypothetical protein
MRSTKGILMRGLAALAIVAALAAAACGDDSSSTTPTTPTIPTTTESFTGVLNQNGGRTHTFITARSGSVTATLVSLGPDSGLTVGLSLGTWNGNACQVTIPKDNAVQTSSILGAASAAGSLCVRIYDVGNITDPVAYQIDVIHP